MMGLSRGTNQLDVGRVLGLQHTIGVKALAYWCVTSSSSVTNTDLLAKASTTKPQVAI